MKSNAKNRDGAAESCAIESSDQCLTPRCGAFGTLEAQNEFSAPPAPKLRFVIPAFESWYERRAKSLGPEIQSAAYTCLLQLRMFDLNNGNVPQVLLNGAAEDVEKLAALMRRTSPQ